MSKPVHDYPLRPLSFEKVKLEDAFWLPRLQTLTEVTVPFALDKTLPAVDNLKKCGDLLHGRDDKKPFSHRFISSDLYKVMEGAAYSLMITPDPKLERRLDEIIETIGDAQQDDGYLYVSHICGVANPGEMGETPYSWVVHSHELYNMGHMYEAAVAYYRATGKKRWLEISEKSARHINRVFFEGDPAYNDGKPVMQAPGHQELELALCDLYRVTGEQNYLDMAKRFLDIRGVTYQPEGEGVMSPTYAQQHLPVREQGEAVGHAVRAGYLYAGMADVSALTGDRSLGDAVDRIWQNIVDTRMHITGGLGAVHGTEGFGPEYELPNASAYNETCAAIANVFFNFRQYLLHQDARYFDVAENALFNNTLAGISISGDEFFYVNPLEADGIKNFNHGKKGRSPWFDCACCPSNLARLLPKLSGYMYAHMDEDIFVTLYGSSRTTIPLAGGNVEIRQTSAYPYDGRVELSVQPEAGQTFALKLRIPTWTSDQLVPGELYRYLDSNGEKWSVEINGEPVDAPVTKGFATLQRTWSPGDKVVLNLPMPVRYSTCSPTVEANRDRVAITRGPLVYCAEEIDNGSEKVQRFFLPAPGEGGEATVDVVTGDPLNGVVGVSVPGMEVAGDVSRAARIEMIPYHAWNNRGEASMIVWIPTTEALARKNMVSNLQASAGYGTVLATHTCDEDSVAAVVDGQVPAKSSDRQFSRWTSRPFKDQRQDITVEFEESRSVSGISVFWCEDESDDALVKLPREWWVEFRNGDGPWEKMKKYVTDFYGLKLHRFNYVRPEVAVSCDALRVCVLPQAGHCVGIHQIEMTF